MSDFFINSADADLLKKKNHSEGLLISWPLTWIFNMLGSLMLWYHNIWGSVFTSSLQEGFYSLFDVNCHPSLVFSPHFLDA